MVPLSRHKACEVHIREAHSASLSEKSEFAPVSLRAVGNPPGHLDPPPRCFCYMLGVSVTHRLWGSLGDKKKTNKQTKTKSAPYLSCREAIIVWRRCQLQNNKDSLSPGIWWRALPEYKGVNLFFGLRKLYANQLKFNKEQFNLKKKPGQTLLASPCIKNPGAFLPHSLLLT